MNRFDLLKEILKKRILVLDGAMGTMIQQYNLSEEDFRGKIFKDHNIPQKGNNDLLSITKPEIIKSIHKSFLEAGADIIETNTFSSTSIGMHDYGMENEVNRLNKESVSIAKEAILEFKKENKEKEYFIAGSIGPTNQALSLSSDVNNPAFRAVTFNDLVSSYKEQIIALTSEGVDILLIETVFDTLNAKAALFACEETFNELGYNVPIMISGTITDASGRTLSGQTPEAFAISVSHTPLLSLGLNCALGADLLLPYLEAIAKETNFFVSVHPNAGLPNAFGEYDETPEKMAKSIRSFLDLGLVNIVGGCCGTTPLHIKEIARITKEYKPRKI